MESDNESQKPVLPKDLFKNAFTWMFYEISKHRFPSVVSCVYLVIVLVGFWWNFADKNLPLSIVLAAVGLFGILFGLIPAWFQNVKEHPNTKKLVQQVLESNPGVDTRKWDEIANILNLFFYRENIWRTPYFFFNGQHVQRVFKYNVLKPYLGGQFEGVADADKIQSAKCYMQSIKVYFELSLKDSISEFFLNSELPRDTHRNKFFFHPRYFFMGFMICFFQGQILLLVVQLFVQRSFWILPTIINYQYCLLKCYQYGYRFWYPEMDVMQAIKFLAIITKFSPRKELDKWDQIARYMNQYLMEGNSSHSRNIFFDGKHCLDCYKACFESLSLGNNSLSYDELKEIVEITQPSLNEETD